MVPVILVLAWLIEAFLVLTILLAIVAYAKLIRYPPREEGAIVHSLLAKGEIRKEQLDRPWIKEKIRSPLGYELAVYGLRGDSDRLALFHHGISWNWIAIFKYMELFSRAGFSVAALDSRGHGASGGGRPSFGVFEKLDLKAAADWALSRFPSEGGFAAFGLSLGAASVIQYAPLDPRLDALVADCPFSNIAAELDHRLKAFFTPFFLRSSVIRLTDFLSRRLDGFSLFEASAEKAIMETEVPVLLIHGLADTLVPPRMSASMAARRQKLLPAALTGLWLVPNASHGRSYKADPAAYARTVLEFVAEAFRSRGKRGFSVDTSIPQSAPERRERFS